MNAKAVITLPRIQSNRGQSRTRHGEHPWKLDYSYCMRTSSTRVLVIPHTIPASRDLVPVTLVVTHFCDHANRELAGKACFQIRNRLTAMVVGECVGTNRPR